MNLLITYTIQINKLIITIQRIILKVKKLIQGSKYFGNFKIPLKMLRD